MMFLFIALFCLQQKPIESVDSAALSLDLTRFVASEDLSASAFWCAPEFLHASLLQRQSGSATEAAKAASAFRHVQLFAVAASERKQDRSSPILPETLAHRLVLRIAPGKEILPLAHEDVPPELRAFAASLRPGLAAALGPSGKNMALVFFPGVDAQGKPWISAGAAGSMTLVFQDAHGAGKHASFAWKLPLPSLLVEKACGKCGEKCRGDWSYCPFDGSKL